MTPTTAAAEAMQRVAPVTSAPEPSAPVVSDQPPAGTPLPVPAQAEVSSACPREMVLVEGEYCTNVFHAVRALAGRRKTAVRPAAAIPKPFPLHRNARQAALLHRPLRVHRAGADLPLNYQSFHKSNALCVSLGKRLCTETEWTFACEGEEMRPYPYGFTRAPKCNQDRDDLYEANPPRQILADRRERADARPDCVTPFGVYNLAGNMDESVPARGQRAHRPIPERAERGLVDGRPQSLPPRNDRARRLLQRHSGRHALLFYALPRLKICR